MKFLDIRRLIAPFFFLSGLVYAYLPGIYGGYVFDDFSNIVHNPLLINLHNEAEGWWDLVVSGNAGPLARPIPMVMFGVEVYYFGFNPSLMKIVNIIIHIFNAGLLFVLLKLLCIRWASFGRFALDPFHSVFFLFVVVSVWAFSPVNLTSVLYVVQRMESLSALFTLLGLLGYMHGRLLMDSNPEKARTGWYWVWAGLIGCGLLAIFSKESGVMLPVYALLLEWLVLGGGQPKSETRRRLFWLYSLVLALPGILGLLWLGPGLFTGAGYEHRTFTLSERLWTEARVLWDYLRWIVFPNPSELSLYHDAYPVSKGPLDPVTSLVGAVGLLALATGAVLVRRRWPWLSLGILWFFVMHLLVSTFVGLELVYEHRNYMGSLGIYLALFGALLLNPYAQRYPFAAYGVALAVIAMYGVFTHMRASEWGHPVKHAYFESQRQPLSPRAAYDLGLMLNRMHPTPDSPSFNDAIAAFERAASLPSTTLLPYQALLFLHGKFGVGDPRPWWVAAHEYVSTQPLSAQDVNALYSLLDAQTKGDIHLPAEPLTELYRRAHLRHPQRADFATLYANALLNVAGDVEQGGQMLQNAVVLAPRDGQIWANLIDYQLTTRQLVPAAASLDRLGELNSRGRYDKQLQTLQQKYQSLVMPKPESTEAKP